MLPLTHREQLRAALLPHLATVRRVSSMPERRDAHITLRRLSAADLPIMEAHLLSLDATDRSSRFHTLLGDAAIRAYVRRMELDRAILIGAIDRASGRLAGLAEAHLDDARSPQIAEMSVSVAAEARGQGLGRALVETALAAAFARGAARAEFFFLPDNRALARLVAAQGAEVDQAAGCASISSRRSLAA